MAATILRASCSSAPRDSISVRAPCRVFAIGGSACADSFLRTDTWEELWLPDVTDAGRQPSIGNRRLTAVSSQDKLPDRGCAPSSHDCRRPAGTAGPATGLRSDFTSDPIFKPLCDSSPGVAFPHELFHRGPAVCPSESCHPSACCCIRSLAPLAPTAPKTACDCNLCQSCPC